MSGCAVSDNCSAPARQQTALRSGVWFVLLWSVGPTLLRAMALGPALGRPGGPSQYWVGVAEVLLLSFPQDVFIAVQILALAVGVKALWTRLGFQPRPITSALAITATFAVVHFYLLFDCLLFRKIGIRMNPAFFDLLLTADCFASSAWEFGLGALAIGAAVLAVSLAGVFWWWRRMAAPLKFSAWFVPVLIAGWFLAATGRDALPPQAGYAADNLLLSDESRLAAAVFGQGSPSSEADKKAALALLRPQAERWHAVSPDYPLMKHTEGFVGDKQFDIDIAPGERPHVVFLFMESFRAADIGVLGGKHGASPQFDRLSKEGVLLTNFYSCGMQTTRAVIAGLFGVPPWFSERSPQEANMRTPLLGVADLFNRRGYVSAYFTGTSLRFERQGEFFGNHGYAEVLGDRDLAQALPKAKRTSWGFHDEYLMDYAADWLRQKDRRGQPAFLTIFTISHHHPWELPEDYPAPKFETGGNEEYGRFLRTFHYADHCLGRFMDRLRATGLDRRTIVFILGDHGCSQHDHQEGFTLVNSLYDENVRIPLLILAPGRIRKPAVLDEVGSQVDLLPTVMDVFGMTGPNHAVGTSLVRRVEGRTAFFNNPFALQFQGMRQGGMKYILTVRTKASSLYDLAADPRECHDLADQSRERVRQCGDAVGVLNRFMLQLYLEGRLAKP